MSDPGPSSDLRVEIALLRGALWLVASSLRRYAEATPFEIDDGGVARTAVVVNAGDREKALGAIARADNLLQGPGREAGR